MIMTTMLNRLAFACLICAPLMLNAASQLPRLQRDDARTRELISEGLSVGRIYAGRSTTDDVAEVYGKTFTTVEHGAQISEMRYETLGLSFYYRRADEQKRVCGIETRAPFEGFTARGIVLGKSNVGDVIKAYGTAEPKAWSERSAWIIEYPGVQFVLPYKELQGKPVTALNGTKITAINVVTSSGGADCTAPNLK
jgi:hypothetical protein